MDHEDNCFDSNPSPAPHLLGWQYSSHGCCGFKQKKINEVFRMCLVRAEGKVHAGYYYLLHRSPSTYHYTNPLPPPSLLPQLLSQPLGFVHTLPLTSRFFLFPLYESFYHLFHAALLVITFLSVVLSVSLRISTSPSGCKSSYWTFCNWCFVCIDLENTLKRPLDWR